MKGQLGQGTMRAHARAKALEDIPGSAAPGHTPLGRHAPAGPAVVHGRMPLLRDRMQGNNPECKTDCSISLTPSSMSARLWYGLPFSRGTRQAVVSPPSQEQLATSVFLLLSSCGRTWPQFPSLSDLTVSVSHWEGIRTGNIFLSAKCILAAELKPPMSSLKNRWLIKVKYS